MRSEQSRDSGQCGWVTCSSGSRSEVAVVCLARTRALAGERRRGLGTHQRSRRVEMRREMESSVLTMRPSRGPARGTMDNARHRPSSDHSHQNSRRCRKLFDLSASTFQLAEDRESVASSSWKLRSPRSDTVCRHVPQPEHARLRYGTMAENDFSRGYPLIPLRDGPDRDCG